MSKFLKGFMDISDAIIKCIEMNNEIKERDAREKASRAASEVYDAVMKKELGYKPSPYSSTNNNLRVRIPAKFSTEYGVTSCCSIYCRAKDMRKMMECNPSLFMHSYCAGNIEFPYDVDAYIVQSESSSFGFEFRVSSITRGTIRTLHENRSYGSINRDSVTLELEGIKNSINRMGFREI